MPQDARKPTPREWAAVIVTDFSKCRRAIEHALIPVEQWPPSSRVGPQRIGDSSERAIPLDECLNLARTETVMRLGAPPTVSMRTFVERVRPRRVIMCRGQAVPPATVMVIARGHQPDRQLGDGSGHHGGLCRARLLGLRYRVPGTDRHADLGCGSAAFLGAGAADPLGSPAALSAFRIAYLRVMWLAACRHIKTAALRLRHLPLPRPGGLSCRCHGETGRGRVRDSPADKVGATEPRGG
jgi:hypothetical protein